MGMYLVLAILLAIPVGYWLAWLARDELIHGRNWFTALCLISSFSSIVSFVLQKTALGFSLLSIGIISYIAYRKSFDKRWTAVKRNV